MNRVDWRDLTCGLLLLGFGAFIIIHVMLQLPLGTVRRMGPGMFPMGVGVLLALFGVLILVPALFRSGTLPAVEWRPALAVLASMSAFALMIRPFGLIPSIIALVLIASLAERRLRPGSALALCAALPLIAWLIFSLALGLPVNMFAVPF